MNKKLLQLGIFVMATAVTLSTPVSANEVDNKTESDKTTVDVPKVDEKSDAKVEEKMADTDSTNKPKKKKFTFEPRVDENGNLILGPDPNNLEPDFDEPDDAEEEEGLENDFRKQVTDVNLPVHRSVLHLILEYGNYTGEQEGLKDEHCTGTVIGKDTLITAAHCVAGEKRGEITGGKAILPLKDGNKEFQIEKAIFHPNWKNEKLIRHRRFDYDVALLKVKPTADGKHIGDILGTVPINSKVEARVGKYVTNPGYPIDKLEKHGITQWDSIGGRIVSEDEYNYKTNHYTRGGQSGSVMLDENKEIIGVLSSGSVDNALFIKMQPELYRWISQYVKFDQENSKIADSTPKDNKKDSQTMSTKKDTQSSNTKTERPENNKISNVVPNEKTMNKINKSLPKTGSIDSMIISLLGVFVVGFGFVLYKFKLK